MYSILSIAFWAQQCKNSIRGVRNFSISTDWRQHGMKHHKYSGAPVSQAIRGDGSKWPPLLSDVSISGEVIYNIPPNPRIFRPCEADVSTTRGSFTTRGGGHLLPSPLMWCYDTTVCRAGYVKRGKRKGPGAPGGRIAYFQTALGYCVEYFSKIRGVPNLLPSSLTPNILRNNRGGYWLRSQLLSCFDESWNKGEIKDLELPWSSDF